MRNLLHTNMFVVQNYHMFLCEINWSFFFCFSRTTALMCVNSYLDLHITLLQYPVSYWPPVLSSSPTLFPKFWLSFLDCGNKHVSSSSSWHSVEATLDTADGDHKQILGTYKCIRKILLKNVKLEETICILTSVFFKLFKTFFILHF